jgi:hypothetical protein
MSDHPSPQTSFQERVERAQKFVKDYNVSFEVYIDPWGDPFENAFHSWPDKYYLVDNNKKICTKSEYSYDAAVMNDYGRLLDKELADFVAP